MDQTPKQPDGKVTVPLPDCKLCEAAKPGVQTIDHKDWDNAFQMIKL